jgi:GT2 family glycosyltransferase
MVQEKLAIIISTYSQDKLLFNNLESIKKLVKDIDYKVYLIDDCGISNISKKIKKDFPWVRFFRLNRNGGFSKANNFGIKKAIREFNPNYLLILNDDCEIIAKNTLNNLIKNLKEEENAGMIGCKLIYSDGSLQWYAKRGKIFFEQTPGKRLENKEIYKKQEVSELIGAFMLIKREVIDKVGMFDEGFSPFYGEESDLCYRTVFAGYKILYNGREKIIHHRNQSIGTIDKKYVWFVKKRNAIRLEWLNHSFFSILKNSFIHFGSTIIKKEKLSIFTRFWLLIKAYAYNTKRLREILNKRKKRR